MHEDRTGRSLPDIRPGNGVSTIIEEKTGKLWFGTRGSSYVYDARQLEGQGRFTVLTNKGKAFTNVSAMIEDKTGKLWLGGNDGLWHYDGSTFTNVTPKPVGQIYADKNGNIWTCSVNQTSDQNWVLTRYEATSLNSDAPTVTEIKPEVGALFTILEAHDGTMWLGSDGVFRYDGKTFHDFRNKKEKGDLH